MADAYGIDWSLARPSVDVGNALLRGIERGRGERKERDIQGALAGAVKGDPQATNALMALSPELGMKVADYQRQQRIRGALSNVFAPTASLTPGANNVASALPNALLTQTPTDQGQIQPASSLPPAAAPSLLIDPATLPPRSDELRVNQEALRALYAYDWETAHKVQSMIYDFDAKNLKNLQAMGEQFASAAWHLKQLPKEDRPAELARMAPDLARLGVTPEIMNQADLSDTGLDRYIATGRNIKDVLLEDRQERRFSWDREDDKLDNERADRYNSSLIEDRAARRALTARGQDITDARARRGQDITSRDRRDIANQTDRRGRAIANQTDQRTRDLGRGRRRGDGAAAGVSNAARIVNPKTGRAAILRGGKWVDEQTGQPVS